MSDEDIYRELPRDGAPNVTPNPWQALRRHTPARLALGRSGGSLPTHAALRFALDHAEARDAVAAPFSEEAMAGDLRPLGREILVLKSAAADRAIYLRRPDLGRQLTPESAATLAARADHSIIFHNHEIVTNSGAPTPRLGPPDLVIVISDGLSARAAHLQAPPLLAALLPTLEASGFHLGPLCIIPRARVGIINEIGVRLAAKCVLILLGERPGLGSADSLGSYFGYAPGPGRTDADRNCISNIRPAGFPPADAARKILSLLEAARASQQSGFQLKESPPKSAPVHIGADPTRYINSPS